MKAKDLTPEEAMGRVMSLVLEPYYKEGKRRIRDQRREEREKREAEREDKGMDLKAACFEVIPEAAAHVSGNYTLAFGVRRLFYAVRDRIPALTSNRFHPEKGYDYFRDTILQEYQWEHGKLKGLYYDPRGDLHEPHGGQTVRMGTREVEAYSFPDHVFNKLLYVEKKGQFPLIQDARIMERYDIAIMTGEGFATEAARTLLEKADKDEEIQIFVLHDADPSGYDIARTVREETRRMPGYSVEVIDLGLTVAQGIEMGLDPEEFERKSALKAPLVEYLRASEPLAYTYFEGLKETIRVDGKDRPIWRRCKRFELDTMTAPETVDLIEKGLRADGVYGKVVPAADELPDLAEGVYHNVIGEYANEVLEDLIGWRAIKRELADGFVAKFRLEHSDRYIGARHKRDDALSWRDALKGVLSDILRSKHTDAMQDDLRKAIREALKDGQS